MSDNEAKEEDDKKNPSSSISAINLPLARVKRIIKSDPSIKLISSDSAVLIAKATELFIEYLSSESLKYTQAENRKILKYSDIANAVNDLDSLMFLMDVIPPKQKSSSGGMKQTTLI